MLSAFLEASIPDDYKAHGSYAVDWTDVGTWARGRTKGGFQTDPTADWGHRRPNGPGKHEPYYGFREQILTMVHNEGGEKVPELVRAVSITNATTHQPPLEVEMLRDLKGRGAVPGDVLADAEYPYADVWTVGVRREGFDVVADLHPELLKRADTHQGAKVVDDLFLCPATPEPLIDIPRPKHDATEQEWATYFAAVSERAKYAFKPHGRMQADGFQRFKCPAECGTCRCALKPKQARTARLDAAKIYAPPQAPGNCCTQGTISVGPNVSNSKARQKHAFYSPEYHASFERRTAVERSFAYTKDKTGVDMTLGSIRMMGVTKHAFLRTIGYVVLNCPLLENSSGT